MLFDKRLGREVLSVGNPGSDVYPALLFALSSLDGILMPVTLVKMSGVPAKKYADMVKR